LRRLGHPHVFLDFRHHRRDHRRRRPIRMAVRGYKNEELPDWTRVIDVVFFNDVMTPGTLLQGRS